MRRLIFVWFVLSQFLLADDDYDQSDRTPLDSVIFSKSIWKKSLAEVKESLDLKRKKELESAKLPDEIKKRIEDGERIVIDGIKYHNGNGFEWLSSAKQGLRSPGKSFTLMGKNVGEVVIRGKKGKVNTASVSLYNRGDDKKILKGEYLELIDDWKSSLDKKFKVRGEERKKSGVVKTTGWMWRKGDVAYLLEGSLTRKTNRPEFVRLRLASANSTRGKKKTKSRRSLTSNVKKSGAGDVYLEGLPMVDQGQKGYCVVASVERVARYYGLNVDQHELAQLANTKASRGTRTDNMEKAFSKITGKIHVKTLALMKYDYKQFERDVKTYNRAAKKAGAKVFPKNYYSAQGFWMQLDKDVFMTVKAKQPKYQAFRKHVIKRVGEGVPLCWTLYLGMFPEKEGAQAWGGHMRIIHGYNEKKDEIIYTDSWGDGHEMKRMPMIHAWCMTTGLYAMIPTN